MTTVKLLILKKYFTGGEWQRVLRYFNQPFIDLIKSIEIN